MKSILRASLMIVPLFAIGTLIVVADEPKVNVCHVPQGNPSNALVITVGQSAAAAHVANHSGDYVTTLPQGSSCPVVRCEDNGLICQ